MGGLQISDMDVNYWGKEMEMLCAVWVVKMEFKLLTSRYPMTQVDEQTRSILEIKMTITVDRHINDATTFLMTRRKRKDGQKHYEGNGPG
jgi:hypothetical protein